MIIIYLIVGFICYFFAYKYYMPIAVNKAMKHNWKSSYDFKEAWMPILIGVLWWVLLPAFILWWLLEKIYNKLNL